VGTPQTRSRAVGGPPGHTPPPLAPDLVWVLPQHGGSHTRSAGGVGVSGEVD